MHVGRASQQSEDSHVPLAQIMLSGDSFKRSMPGEHCENVAHVGLDAAHDVSPSVAVMEPGSQVLHAAAPYSF